MLPKLPQDFNLDFYNFWINGCGSFVAFGKLLSRMETAAF